MESANGTVNGVLTTRNITAGSTASIGTIVGDWRIAVGSSLTGNVVIPTASTTQLGGIKVGTGLTIDGNGVLSASGGVSGVSQIVAGTNVTISPSNGTGIVTINASGGGGGSGVTSVGITSGDLTITNSPITGSGSIGLSLNTVPLNKGGTGQTSAAAAINALMPNQSGNSGALLTTNGTNLSWQAFPRSVGPSGYTTLPGNVILYWGSVTTPNVDIGDHYVMPVTFPAGLFGQVFNVTGIVNSVPSTSGPGGPDAFMSVSNLSATGMNVIFTERNPSFVLSVRTAMFQVIGVPPIPGAPSNVQIAQSWVNNGDGTSNGTLTASSNGNTPLTFNWSYIDSGNVLTWSASGNVATIKSPNNVFNASTSVSVTVTNNVGSAIGSTVAVNPNYEPDGGGGGTFDVSSGGPAPGEAS
jgi:hypothetical protein